MRAARTAKRLIAGACLTVVFSSSNAADSAGVLSQTDGFTVVSKGAQYVEAYEGMALEEGDRLMALEGGSAVISFADGCHYRLTENELFTMGSSSTCASTAVSSYKVDPYSAVSQDSSVATSTYRQAAIGEGGNDDSDDLAWWVPATAGAVIIAAVAFDTGSDTRDSISP